MSRSKVLLYAIACYFVAKYLIEPSPLGGIIGGILSPISAMITGLFSPQA